MSTTPTAKADTYQPPAKLKCHSTVQQTTPISSACKESRAIRGTHSPGVCFLLSGKELRRGYDIFRRLPVACVMSLTWVHLSLLNPPC